MFVRQERLPVLLCGHVDRRRRRRRRRGVGRRRRLQELSRGRRYSLHVGNEIGLAIKIAVGMKFI